MEKDLDFNSKNNSEDVESINKEEKNKVNEKKENKTSEKNDLSNNEEEKIKQSLTPILSTKELLIKSIKISLKNWRQNLYTQIEFFVLQLFGIYLPIVKANIIDSITSSKTFDEIFIHFKKYMSFLLLRIFTEQLLELLEYFFVTNEANKYKNILLKRIIKKDISFFDLFKTGELIEKIQKYQSNIEEDFISKSISLVQNIIKLYLMIYYLYKTSLKLSLITIGIFIFNALADFLENKYSFLADYKVKIKADILYHDSLNQLLSNIRMIKSFNKEDDGVKKIEKYKKMSQFDTNILSIFIFKITSLIEEGSEAVTLLFTGKYILEKKFSLGKFTVFKQYLDEISNSYFKIKNILNEYNRLEIIL